MSEASDLEREVAELEDADLQKRFNALFDDGQGENARRALISYCRQRSYHPAEMYILCGQNMFKRLRDMIKRQEELLEEYRSVNKYLIEESRKLNGGKLSLPPVTNLRRRALFQKLIRQKFGHSNEARKAARQALDLDAREFSKLAAGAGLTNGFIEYLEALPDYNPPTRKQPKKIKNAKFAKLEKMLAHITKPKKHSRQKSDMTAEELQRIGEMMAGDDWVSALSQLTDYSEWHFHQFVKSADNRSISVETAQYLRLADSYLRQSGETFGPSIVSGLAR